MFRAIALILFLFSSVAHAGNLYVATNGSDSNPGTLASPLRTITAAASRSVPGTTVYVRGGVYSQRVSIASTGTASLPIVFRPYTGENVILDGSGLSRRVWEFVRIRGSYNQFLGFTVRNAPNACVYVEGSYNYFGHNVVTGCKQNGVLAYASTNGKIEHNTIYNVALVNQNKTSGWPYALGAADSNNVVMNNNKVYQNYGEGIGSLRSNGTVISHNTVYDNYSVNVYLDNTANTTVDSNFIYFTGDTRFLYQGSRATLGIGIANEVYSSGTRALNNLLIKNNITVGTRYGFYYGNYGLGGGLQNSNILNNTFVNSTDAGIFVDPDRHSNTRINGNVVQSNGSALASGSTSGVTFGYQCWWGGSVPTIFRQAGDITANPQLASAGTFNPNGYVMSSSSTCARGYPLNQNVLVDFYGKTRYNPTSMGASQP